MSSRIDRRGRAVVALIAAGAVAAAAGTAIAGGGGGGGESAATRQLPLFAVLRGSNEIGADGRRNAGDRDGRGAFNAIIDEGRICFGLSVTNVGTPNAAHIHRGGANRVGPPVVTLDEPADGDPGASSGCTEISSELARGIRRNPARYYVNVHNADFPGGAVRGQLFEVPRR